MKKTKCRIFLTCYLLSKRGTIRTYLLFSIYENEYKPEINEKRGGEQSWGDRNGSETSVNTQTFEACFICQNIKTKREP